MKAEFKELFKPDVTELLYTWKGEMLMASEDGILISINIFICRASN